MTDGNPFLFAESGAQKDLFLADAKTLYEK